MLRQNNLWPVLPAKRTLVHLPRSPQQTYFCLDFLDFFDSFCQIFVTHPQHIRYFKSHWGNHSSLQTVWHQKGHLWHGRRRSTAPPPKRRGDTEAKDAAMHLYVLQGEKWKWHDLFPLVHIDLEKTYFIVASRIESRTCLFNTFSCKIHYVMLFSLIWYQNWCAK